MIAQLRQTGGRKIDPPRQNIPLPVTPVPVGVFLTLSSGFIAHYLSMEAHSVTSQATVSSRWQA